MIIIISISNNYFYYFNIRRDSFPSNIQRLSTFYFLNFVLSIPRFINITNYHANIVFFLSLTRMRTRVHTNAMYVCRCTHVRPSQTCKNACRSYLRERLIFLPRCFFFAFYASRLTTFRRPTNFCASLLAHRLPWESKKNFKDSLILTKLSIFSQFI